MFEQPELQHKEVALLGGGGHAKVVADLLLSQGCRVKAIVAPKVDQACAIFQNLSVYTDLAFMKKFADQSIVVVNGVGSLPGSVARRSVFDQYSNAGFRFVTSVSAYAVVSQHALFDDGVQVLHGSVIQIDCRVGKNTIINTGAIVEHDCTVGEHCHIAPSATLCGNVTIGDRTHIGAGATVIQGITIGEDVVVGAGAIVTKDLPNGAVFFGARGVEKPKVMP